MLNPIIHVNIYLPDFSTQQKIAAVLSALDDKIELNNKINAELEAMAKTLYDYWFVQFDFPDVHGNPYKSSGGKREYNAILKREILAGWEVKSLEYIADIIGRSTPSKEVNEYFTHLDSPKVGLQNYVLIIDEINRGEKVDSMYAVDGKTELVLPPTCTSLAP